LKNDIGDENPVDASYKALNVNLSPLDKSSDEWKIVET